MVFDGTNNKNKVRIAKISVIIVVIGGTAANTEFFIKTFMYKACIIEDEDEIRSFFKSTLQRLFNLENTAISFDDYSSGTSFISSFQNYEHYDVIFLDIEMPGLNGIEVCKKIRSAGTNALIVFISNKESLVFDTFEVEPFRFIRKRFFDELAPDLVKAIKIKLEEKSKDLVFITEESTRYIYNFNLSELLYIEAQRKDCCFVTKSNNVVIRIPFQNAEKILSEHNFIQTHRSYSVNLRHIFYIGKDKLQLTTKDTVPVSRSKLDEVKQAFLNFSLKQ